MTRTNPYVVLTNSSLQSIDRTQAYKTCKLSAKKYASSPFW